MTRERSEMQTRMLGGVAVPAIGLGCMNLSHAYGTPPDAGAAGALLNAALDAGCTHLDTAALYGFGANEELLGRAIGHRRGEFFLASKCGTFRNAEGKREIDGRPEVLRRTCEGALQRLRTEVIDLYYLHRWDRRVPIEESIGALAELVAAGKVRALGLSEVSAATLRRAHAVHPIAALQSEYSLWTRNPEIAVLDACRELGISFVAFSPLGRGFLSGAVTDPTRFEAGDLRRYMPRFAPDNFARNLPLVQACAGIARELGCSMAQLALAWVLARGDDILPLPGTTRIDHLHDNLAAGGVRLSAEVHARLEALFDRHAVHGGRYGAATQAEVDTEEFA